MRIFLSALPVVLLACGGPASSFTIQVDGSDYGAIEHDASLSKVDEGWLLVLSGRQPEDPKVLHDEYGLYLWIVLRDLDRRVDGETLVIDGVSSFETDLEPTRARPIDVTTVAGPTQDPGIVSVSLRQGCHCFPAVWADQTVSGSLTLTEVSTDRVEGTIELETSGGLPQYERGSAPQSHTTKFAGSFQTD